MAAVVEVGAEQKGDPLMPKKPHSVNLYRRETIELLVNAFDSII